MYKLFLTLRYLRKRRIAYFAIAAVLLCTAMVLIVMSVMGGFLDQLKLKARGLLGDIIIDNKSYSGFPLYEEFIADISAWPEVVRATPVIYTYGLLRFNDTPQTNTVQVVGIRLQDVYEVNAFRSSLYYERFYPGTTTLAEQRQPRLGFVQGPETVPWLDQDGGRAGDGPPPMLPPEYQAAREQSWKAGVVDNESPPTEWGVITQAAGRAPLVGVYEPVEGLGAPDMTGEPHPGVIIGRDIVARRLPDGKYKRYWQYPRGSLMTLTLLPATEGGTLDTPVKSVFRYADDSRTGIYEIDSRHVYVDFAVLQQLLRMDEAERVDSETGEVVGRIPARCSQIQVKIRPGTDARALARRLSEHYQSLPTDPRFEGRLTLQDLQLISFIEGMTWEESQAHIIAPVEKERLLVTMLFGIISLVAAVLVLCILYMIALQKTRDIGIVKAIGGSSAGVAMIFVSYGAAIGIVGSLVGTVLGYYFVTYINQIQELLIWLNPALQVWDRSVYSFDQIPNTVRAEDMVAVIVLAIVLSTLGSVMAALRAGFMHPVEALRHE